VIALDQVALLRPWWLLALPALAMLFVLTRPRAAGLADWDRAVDPPLLAAMLRRGGAAGTDGLMVRTVALAIVLTVLALSGPAVRRADTEKFRNLDATLLAVDLSNEATGAAQLQQAKTAAHLLLEQAGARQLGLILYAGDAYLASPLTDDAAATSATVFALDDQTVPDPGVRPDRALALARRTLREARIIGGDVVLISAGRGLDPTAMREADALAAEGHVLHALFVPPAAPGELPDAARRAALVALARAGHGVEDDVGRPGPVLSELSGRAIRHTDAAAVGGLAWYDVGRFLLIAAAIPLLLAFRRSTR
jgi:Ca-activated chloride channel family protein